MIFAMVTPVLLIAPLILIGIAFSIAALAFWIWMIVDCAVSEPAGNEKIVWLLVIILLHFIGALIYFFVRRLNRPQRTGTPPIATPPRF